MNLEALDKGRLCRGSPICCCLGEKLGEKLSGEFFVTFPSIRRFIGLDIGRMGFVASSLPGGLLSRDDAHLIFMGQ